MKRIDLLVDEVHKCFLHDEDIFYFLAYCVPFWFPHYFRGGSKQRIPVSFKWSPFWDS